MLTGNVHLLVEDLESLLKDICEFLSENVNDGFSGKQKLLAEKLIHRSKSQLQTITKFTATIAEPDTSYVDMTKVPFPIKEEIKEVDHEEYAAIDDQQMTRECPYTCKSALEVKENNQWGYLERRKSLWFLGHQIKLFGVVTDGWMLLYNSEKDSKPIESVNLEMYIVKCCDSKDPKYKKDARSFELISATKSYQFIAKNTKDMDQWVTAISKNAKTTLDENMVEGKMEFKQPNKPKILIKELPPLPQSPSIPNPYITKQNSNIIDEPMAIYDAIHTPTNEEYNEAEENIYELPVRMTTPSLPPTQKQEELPPPLPPPLQRSTKSFLYSLDRKNVQSVPHSNDVEDEEEVEYDVPLNEKNQAPPPLERDNKSITSNFSGMTQRENFQPMKNEPEEEYDEVMAPTTKKPGVKLNIQQWKNNKANLKQTPPKVQPKPMFAGINRGSFKR